MMDNVNNIHNTLKNVAGRVSSVIVLWQLTRMFLKFRMNLGTINDFTIEEPLPTDIFVAYAVKPNNTGSFYYSRIKMP